MPFCQKSKIFDQDLFLVVADLFFKQFSPPSSFLKRGGGSLNGKSLSLKTSRTQCAAAAACVCVCGISYWKKNRVLRSHLMTRSLCTGACNENQGCVPLREDAMLNRAHLSRERPAAFTRRVQAGGAEGAALTCEPRDPDTK